MNIGKLATFAVIAAMTIAVLPSPASAQGNGARSLEGVWDVSTNPPGVPGVATRRIHTYHTGGTAYDHAGGTEMPAHGVWEHVGRGDFEAVFWRFVRDAAGQITFIVRVRSRIHMLSPDEYENEAKIDVFAPSSEPLANLRDPVVSFNATGRGRRVKFESFN
jgi:hypothetical protein